MFTNNLSFGTMTVFTETDNILKFFVKNFFSAIISGVFSVTSNRRNFNVSQNEMLISLERKYHVRSSCAPRIHSWICFINIYFHMDFIVNKIYIFFCTSLVEPKQNFSEKPILFFYHYDSPKNTPQIQISNFSLNKLVKNILRCNFFSNRF